MKWKSLFVRNKYIKAFLTVACGQSIIHNIASSSEKVVSPVNQERNMHISSENKWKQSKTVLNNYVVDFDVRGKTENGVFHWRKHYYVFWTNILARSVGLKSKPLDWSVSSKKAIFFFTLQVINSCTGDYLWIIVMFYQLFGLSFWRHPFTAEDTLVSKWCNAKFLLMKKLTHLHLERS